MNGSWEADEADLEALDEAYDEAFDEADYEAYGEARRPRRRPPTRPVPTAGRATAFRPRPPAGATSAPVTQAQLQAALARVSQQMNTNSTAVRTLDGRVRALSAEQTRVSAMVRRETAGLRRDLQSTREMIALVGLLFPPGSSGSKFAPLAFMLPPDFLSGGLGGQSQSGTTGQSGGGMLGGNNGMVALIAVAAATGMFGNK